MSADIAKTFASLATSTTATHSSQNIALGGRILWVGDHPQNNLALSNAFQKLGITVMQSATTADALGEIKKGEFDAVMTNMTGDLFGHEITDDPSVVYNLTISGVHAAQQAKAKKVPHNPKREKIAAVPQPRPADELDAGALLIVPADTV